jgi:hypothetical protein
MEIISINAIESLKVFLSGREMSRMKDYPQPKWYKLGGEVHPKLYSVMSSQNLIGFEVNHVISINQLIF